MASKQSNCQRRVSPRFFSHLSRIFLSSLDNHLASVPCWRPKSPLLLSRLVAEARKRRAGARGWSKKKRSEGGHLNSSPPQQATTCLQQEHWQCPPCRTRRHRRRQRKALRSWGSLRLPTEEEAGGGGGGEQESGATRCRGAPLGTEKKKKRKWKRVRGFFSFDLPPLFRPPPHLFTRLRIQNFGKLFFPDAPRTSSPPRPHHHLSRRRPRERSAR